jgi:hypothetical protein
MLCALQGTIGRKAPKSAALRRVRICRSTLGGKDPPLKKAVGLANLSLG